jgi:gluconolactonase
MPPQSSLTIVTCLVGFAFLLCQSATPQQPPAESTATAIPGVIADGAKVQLVWSGFESADGIVGAPDGSLLFAQQVSSRVSKIDKDGKVSSYLEDTNGAGALAIDYKGNIVDVERMKPQVRILAPNRKLLADSFEGKPLVALRDLCVDKEGGVYITDGTTPKRSGVYYINSAGVLKELANDIEVANGILLSPDEKTLYISNTPSEFLLAFDVGPNGTISNRRNFARLEGDTRNGGDGLAIDSAGRLYVATNNNKPLGIQVFSAKGEYLGTIPTPRPTTSVAFAGPDKKTLFIVARGAEGTGDERWARSIYKVSMVAQGYRGRAK